MPLLQQKFLILSFTFVCTENFLFPKFKDRTWTKSELDERTPMTYRYIKFELNVCNCCRDYEWKVNDDGSTEGCNDRTG